jgi:amino acid adenylation domain-containing protein
VWFDRTPEAAAVACGDVSLSYAEVGRRADRIAGDLQDAGVGAESVVGVLMQRSEHVPIALLGVLRAGAAYLPVNPADPDDYIRESFSSTGVRVVVTDNVCATRTASLDPDLAVVRAELARAEPEPSGRRPGRPPVGDSLQYVIRTSGSTGRPKSIAMAHHPQSELLRWSQSRYAERATALHYFPVTSDVASLDIFMTWATGGCLVVATDEQRHDITAVVALIATHGVTRALLPVAVLHRLARHCAPDFAGLSSLRELITTGEQLTITPEVRAMVTALGDEIVLDDHYGSSEVNVVTAPRLAQPAAAWPDTPQLGSPIVGARIYVLDATLSPVPRNVVGEIYVGGDPLARGYVDQGGLTAASFVPDPFSRVPGARMYRTGDLGRWRAGGRLEFLGRNDFQVQVRGYRVEPAEVERALASHPEVDQALVMLARLEVEDRGALTAYVVPVATGGELDVESVRAHAALVLPGPMVPEFFVTLDAFPVLDTGKVDRSQLPRPSQQSGSYTTPQDDLEEEIAEIWGEVLGKDGVGAEENFFALGGHSLLVTRIVYELREAFDIDVPLVAMFQHPTVRGLAGQVRELLEERS